MAKNHTTHKSRMAHRNGIKKPRSNRYESMKGVVTKFMKNMPNTAAKKIADAAPTSP
uniref:60S ribosomal protein L29 n=1 Tax=Oncorhynchus kisutch TaxID=8019 RepID=A0A8C7MLW2_ONCKI